MNNIRLAALLGLAGLIVTGCARPNEIGYTPAYTTSERGAMIARNWDLEGKEMQDDIDHDILMDRPANNLTIWNVRGGY
jgi:hypothetical protein